MSRQKRGKLPLKKIFRDFRNEQLSKLLLLVLFVIVIGGAAVFIAEQYGSGGMFSRFFDSIWWSIVTLTTVGYGDKVPVTLIGRILASILMLTGVVITSVLSGTIASVFVDRKIREGKGLQEIVVKNHTVICGWNRNVEGILDSFITEGVDLNKIIVLINEMDPENIQVLATKYSSLEIRFVRGDFTNEKVLKRGSLGQAKSAIVVSDVSGSNSLENADERTILAVLAIKSMNSDIVTCAELVNKENEQHLKRANVDDIIVNGEFSGFLLATATRAPGIPKIVREMLSDESKKGIRQIPISSDFIGRTFLELSEHFLKTGKGVVIGIMSEEKKMSLDDMLSDDSSSIDAFIKKKFMEAEINLSDEEQQDIDIHLSPGPDYHIKDTDSAFIIGTKEEV